MISFLTLFAKDVERTADVYRLFGFEFAPERHGTGPPHLASVAGGLVIEIYPGEDTASSGVMIGIEVADLDLARTRLLEAGVPLLRDIGQAGEMRRLVTVDPEGRKIFARQTSIERGSPA